MKKMTVVVMALGLAVALFGIASAGNRGGMGGGCGNCAQGGAAAPSEQIRKFQADTIDLRQEMMIKRFDIQRENLKATPDAAKIAAIKADIKNIQSKIKVIRDQSGLSNDKCDGECGQGMGDCGQNAGAAGKKKMGGCGGRGGCGNGPCGGQK